MQKLLWPLALFGGAALYSKFKRPAQGEQAEEPAPAGEADDVSHIGMLEWQQLRQQRAAAQATPRERVLNDFKRGLDLLEIEANDLGEDVFQALRRLRGDALHAELQQLSVQLEDMLTRLDMVQLGEAEDTVDLRRQRREIVTSVQAELEGIDNFRQDFAAARSIMRRLNTVLDALCQQQPDFCCPITHDIMRQPVIASSSRTYEASALRTHCAAQRSQNVRPTCPLTTRVLDPAQERPNRELQFAINTAVRAAIAESDASEVEQAAMWARWWRE